MQSSQPTTTHILSNFIEFIPEQLVTTCNTKRKMPKLNRPKYVQITQTCNGLFIRCQPKTGQKAFNLELTKRRPLVEEFHFGNNLSGMCKYGWTHTFDLSSNLVSSLGHLVGKERLFDQPKRHLQGRLPCLLKHETSYETLVQSSKSHTMLQ